VEKGYNLHKNRDKASFGQRQDFVAFKFTGTPHFHYSVIKNHYSEFIKPKLRF
jgi:hypothetical protein